MGKKKEIKEEVQFIKFIKNLYKDEVQLNFDEYFIINVYNNKISLYFPKDKYYRLCGSLSITNADSFKDWLLLKDGSIKIYNSDLDELRKLKLGYFLSIDKTDDEYKINLDPESGMKFSMKREKPIIIDNDFDFKYEEEIPADSLIRNSLFVAYNDNNKIKFTNTCSENNILFDSAIKNFKIIFKKDATYKFHATDKDADGYRVVMIEGAGELCQLYQYFRVI